MHAAAGPWPSVKGGAQLPAPPGHQLPCQGLRRGSSGIQIDVCQRSCDRTLKDLVALNNSCTRMIVRINRRDHVPSLPVHINGLIGPVPKGPQDFFRFEVEWLCGTQNLCAFAT